MRYPKEIPVLRSGQVGRYALTKRGGPYCAIGWFNYILQNTGDTPISTKLRKTYRKCAIAAGILNHGIMSTNDGIRSPATRALLVNAAFAAIGYVVGQDKKAVKLAKKAGYTV